MCMLQFYDGDIAMKKTRSKDTASSYNDDSISMCSFKDSDEKQVFEDQLNHLQEQLVSAMIENQTLGQVYFFQEGCAL